MRSTACLALALAWVPVAEAQRSGELFALEGAWSGSYSCSGSLTPMDLSMTGSLENGGIAGTINHPSCSTFRVTPADR